MKLLYTITDNPIGPKIERWKLDQDIIAHMSCGTEDYSITIDNSTGDITDQIYERIDKINIFPDITLESCACYYMRVPTNRVMELLKYIENMDKTGLKEGKSY